LERRRKLLEIRGNEWEQVKNSGKQIDTSANKRKQPLTSGKKWKQDGN